MQLLKWLGVMGAVLLMAGCASSTDPAETYRGESAEHIYTQGEKALKNHHYEEAIRRFDALDVQYPYSPHSRQAQLHVIYAHFMHEDYPSTQSAAERYIHAWPANPDVAYAYYMRALAYYRQNIGIFERIFPVELSRRDLTPIKQAFQDFAVVAKQFPKSPYAPAAARYMIHLRNMIAQHELQVGEYYYKRGAYVAAANRATEVIRHYQGAPAVRPALYLLANSYHQLHSSGSEREVREIIRYNHL